MLLPAAKAEDQLVPELLHPLEAAENQERANRSWIRHGSTSLQ